MPRIRPSSVEHLEKRIDDIFKAQRFVFGGITLLLIIFGLFLGYVTLDSKSAVDQAITDMEERFEELAGEALKKPNIQIILDESFPDTVSQKSSTSWSIDLAGIRLKNTGNRMAEIQSIRLYLRGAERWDGGEPYWFQRQNQDSTYTGRFDLNIAMMDRIGRLTLSPTEPELLPPGEFGVYGQLQPEIEGALKIYFGADQPADTTFTIQVKR